jgi:hypothetical protein
VIEVDSMGLTQVGGFTIRTDDGSELRFRVGNLEPGSFPAGHLTEHAATGAPVRVTFVVEGDGLIAVRLSDAD